jgi:DNA polymerase-3 subunit gamma/tau
VQSSFNRQDDNVTLLLRAEHRHLLASSASDQIEQLLRQHLAPEITLAIEIGSDQQLTPDQLAINLHQQRLELASQCIETDTFIRQFEQRFDAQINRDSINYRRLNKVS